MVSFIGKVAVVVWLVVGAVGCTTAGPFVSNISSDGKGNLIIEKTSVKMNALMGTISNESTTTTTIYLGEPKK